VKAYYNEWLLLPRERFNIPSLQNALTFPLKSRDRITGFITAYKLDDDYIYVPREFYSEDYLSKLNIELEYQLPDKYKTVNFTDNVLLDALDPKSTVQKQSFQAMKDNLHGILSLGCGKGKTVLALKYAAFLKRPTLVIVDTTTLLQQWAEQAQQFLGLKEKQIGIIQGPPATWTAKKPLVIATVQSLARYAKEVPRDIREHYGLVVWDEAHHLSAPHYNKTAALFPGIRLGLSATPERLDGLEDLYFIHIGKVFFRDYSQALVPKVVFHEVNLGVDWNSQQVLDKILDRTGELSWTKLWGFLGSNQGFLDEAVDLVLTNVKRGRKILVLSNRLNTIKSMNEALNVAQAGVSDAIIGKTEQGERLNVLRNSPVTVASTKLAREAIDEPSLDTLIILEPFKDPYTLRQAVGRILRTCSTKKAPEVHIMKARFGPCLGMAAAMAKNFKAWPSKPKVIQQ
jgi:superfamily II DNA or RNA helicase